MANSHDEQRGGGKESSLSSPQNNIASGVVKL